MDNRDLARRFLELAGATDFHSSPEGWVCRCPFHDGPNGFHKSKNPSFSINATSGAFMCFSGVCGRRGSMIYLLMDRCGYSFSRAKELVGDVFQYVAAMEGELPDFNARRLKSRDEAYDSMKEIQVELLGIFDRCPQYMLDRGFAMSVLKQWDVGYDMEARRVTIPVWTKDHRLVGITKRSIDEWVEPRYKHLYFEKSMLLYGEHLIDEVTEAEPLIVVESQMSVLWLYQAGIRNAVSTLGSQVSQRQIERMSRYPWIVLGFDEDDAGMKATQRVLHGRDSVKRDPVNPWRKILVHEPGLVERIRRGRVKVVETYGMDRLNAKTGRTEKCKDFQEVPLHLAVEAARGAVPWELWNLHESS